MTTVGRLEKPLMIKDYFDLAKPRVILLHLVTAASAMFLAARGVPPGFKVLYTLLGGGLAAGAANALNCYFDRDIDVIMPRTRRRPLASNRLKPHHALIFAVVGAVIGVAAVRVVHIHAARGGEVVQAEGIVA